MKVIVARAWALVAPLSPAPSLSASPRLRSLWCVQPEVSCQEFDEWGGEWVSWGGKGRARKGPEENPSFSRVLTLPNLTQLPLFLPSPSLISSPFLFSFVVSHLLFLCLPFLDPSSLCTFLSVSHVHLSSQAHTPAAIRQDSAPVCISRAVSIWHRASRPLRHSPVPPHPALLVTWDNWRRNSDGKLALGFALSSAQGMRWCFKNCAPSQKKLRLGGGGDRFGLKSERHPC